MARAQVSTALAVLKTRSEFRLQRLKRTAFTLNLESQLLFIRYDHLSTRRTAHLTVLRPVLGAVRASCQEYRLFVTRCQPQTGGSRCAAGDVPGQKYRGLTLEIAYPQAWKLFIWTREPKWAEFLRFVYDLQFCRGSNPFNAIRRRSRPARPHRALPGFCLEGRSATRCEFHLRPIQPHRVRTVRPRPAPC